MTVATALAFIIAVAPASVGSAGAVSTVLRGLASRFAASDTGPDRQAQTVPRGVRHAVAARPDRQRGMSRYILVRHCEKAGGATDPGLTAEGEARAQALVNAIGEEKVDVIYSTPFKRTQATVQPLAAAKHVSVSIVEGTNDKAFAKRLLTDHKGQAVVIASHINVIPDLVKFLGVHEKVTLDEGAYGDMFIVDVDAKGRSRLTRARFGE